MVDGKTHPDPPAAPDMIVEMVTGKPGPGPVFHFMNRDWDPICGFGGACTVTNNRADVNCQKCQTLMRNNGT